MSTMYVECYLGPRRCQRAADQPVFWFAFGRWWSGATTGILSDQKTDGHYTQINLDADCRGWSEGAPVGWVPTSMVLDSAYRTEPVIGYFDNAAQQMPKHDPGLAVECPLCQLLLTRDDVRTVSVMPYQTKDGENVPRMRSYFYRLHRTCAEKATAAQHQALDEYAMAWLPPGIAN